MTQDILNASEANPDTDVSSLVSLGGGGAARPPEQVKSQEKNHPTKIAGVGYGLTETNAGGTNALRSVGIIFALFTFSIDLLKGIIPVYLSQEHGNLMFLCGFSAMLGHVYPIFYNFKGGKGAGTLLGVLIIANPQSLLFVLSSWIIVLIITGFVGLSTMVACAVLFLYSFSSNPSFIMFSMIAFIFILFTHKSNIKRLRAGEENQFKKIMIFKRKQK